MRRNRVDTALFLQLTFCCCRSVTVEVEKWHGRGRRFDPDQVHQFLPLPEISEFMA